MLQELVSLVSRVVELLGKGRETQLAALVSLRLSRSKKSPGSLIVDLCIVPCLMDPKRDAEDNVLVVLSP